MDAVSVISESGLEAMANTHHFMSNTQREKMERDKQADQERRREKERRKREQEERRQQRLETMSAITAGSFKTPKMPDFPVDTPADAASKIDQLVELSVVRALQKHMPPPPPAPQSFVGYEMEDDVDYRLRKMQESGVKYSEGFDFETADKRRKEMEHWRMKLSLEERELEQNCATFIAVGANLFEGLCDAIDFHAFETKGLSEQMQSAIDDGRFTSCIKQYANMGGGTFMKHPVLNFLTTFSSIALKNHLNKKRGSLFGDTKGSTKKFTTSAGAEAPVHGEERPTAPYPHYHPYPAPYPPYPPPYSTPYPPYPTPYPPYHPPAPVAAQPPVATQPPVAAQPAARPAGRKPMTETVGNMQLDGITSKMSSFAPVLSNVKTALENGKKNEEDRARLEESAPKPMELAF